MKTRCVVFLQNAWSPMYAGDIWPRESWLAALHRSLTGRRLAEIFPRSSQDDVWFDNTTPMVSEEPSGICPPDRVHILSVLAEQSPRFVLACGNQAWDAVSPLWLGKLIGMPHPAWRLMPNALLRDVQRTIFADDFHRVRFTASKGGIITATNAA